MNRRVFLATSATALGSAPFVRATGKPRRLLLRSSWQAFNIGDIAHTPGMLALLETHMPEVGVTLWPSPAGMELGVDELLVKRFPKLQIARSPAEQEAAIRECDFFLHGSGPSLIAATDLERWAKTGKPYGIGGTTLNAPPTGRRRDLIAGAKFYYLRDSISLSHLKKADIAGPVQGFGPDATFAVDVRNDARAQRTLAKLGLKEKQYLCVIPKLRATPYWEMYESASRHPKHALETPEEIAAKEAINERTKEGDHAKLRTAINAWVRKTGKKVLICPELTYEVALMRPLLYDPLPEDVKRHVTMLERYWLTDEAASVYARATALLSPEMHSPIIAIAQGTPAIHVTMPGDGHKSEMWNDVGLGDWLFSIEKCSGEQLAESLLMIDKDQEKASRRATDALAKAKREMTTMMATLKKCLA